MIGRISVFLFSLLKIGGYLLLESIGIIFLAHGFNVAYYTLHYNTGNHRLRATMS